jgi:hypothetical protein
MLQNAHRRVWFWTWQALYAEGMKKMLEQYFTGKPLPEENCIASEGGKEGGRGKLSSQNNWSRCVCYIHTFEKLEMISWSVKKCTDEIKSIYYVMCVQ